MGRNSNDSFILTAIASLVISAIVYYFAGHALYYIWDAIFPLHEGATLKELQTRGMLFTNIVVCTVCVWVWLVLEEDEDSMMYVAFGLPIFCQFISYHLSIVWIGLVVIVQIIAMAYYIYAFLTEDKKDNYFEAFAGAFILAYVIMLITDACCKHFIDKESSYPTNTSTNYYRNDAAGAPVLSMTDSSAYEVVEDSTAAVVIDEAEIIEERETVEAEESEDTYYYNPNSYHDVIETVEAE